MTPNAPATARTRSKSRRPVWPTRFATIDRLEERRLLSAYVAGKPTAYATIQEAVDAATSGGTINVEAGSYAGQVYVNKPLTIRGAQANVDARSNDRQNVAESIVTGTRGADGLVNAAFYVNANNVTIDGFVVQGNTSKGDSGAGIVIAPNRSGTRVFNNVVQNNVSGLFLANASSTNAAVIQHNVFRNNNNGGPNGGRGIYTNGAISGGRLTNVTIDGNAFLNNRGGSNTTTLESAIAFESGTANSQSDVRITGNVFDGNGKAVLFFHTTNALIEGNVITRTLDWYSGTLRFEGDNHDVIIRNNTVYLNTGPGVAIDAKGVPGDSSGFVITGNNFYGNSTTAGKRVSVVVNPDNYIGSLDVRNNWWGNASGPSGDGSGTGDAVYGNGHVVSGQAWYVAPGGTERFSPWSTAPNGAIDTPYFGTAFSTASKIQAEDFNHGGQGVAFSDTDTGNNGGRYRTTAVDIENTADAGGGSNVGFARAGEWLDYTVDVAQAGNYRVDFRIADSGGGSKFHMEVDGVNVTGAITTPNTTGWQAWQTLSVGGVALSAGQHTFRVAFDVNGAGGASPNLNWFQLTNTTPTPAPTAPSNLAASATSSSQVALAWVDTATNETGFRIERSTDGVTFTPVANTPPNAVGYTDTGLSANTTYAYRVLATSGSGNSAYSNVASALTMPSATSPTYLSDMPWVSATSGWQTVQRDVTIKGETITLRGTTYDKGLGTHSASQIVYNLAGRFGTFVADAGVDDEVNGRGAVVFQVIGDGRVLYDSGVVTGKSAVAKIEVSVSGVQQLTLLATNGITDSIDFDHADWAAARLLITAPTPTAPVAPSSLTALAASPTQVNLAWTNNASNQTAFRIDRSTDGVNFTTIATPAASATTFAATGLTAGTTYHFCVRAVNSIGESANSNVAVATTSVANSVTYLSDLNWESATVDWGTIRKNLSIKGLPITIRGTTYATGVGTHASSTIIYDLAGAYATFEAFVGIDDATAGRGEVNFQVIGDGRVLYESGVLSGASPVAPVSVSVAGVRQLSLVASPGASGSIDFAHADWADAKLTTALVGTIV